MNRHLRATALLAVALLVALPSAAATAKEMYATAAARAKGLHDDDDPSVKDYRSAAAAFEAVVRLHPTTGYADNALLEAAALSREAYERFGDGQDKTSALRLLNWLLREYPASPLLPRARDEVKRCEAAQEKPAVPAAARNESRRGAVEPGTATSQGNLAVLREVRRAEVGDVVRVTIELDTEVIYRTERVENPARVLFDLDATRLGPSITEGSLSYPADVVRHIRIGRHPNRVLRVVLDIEGVKKYSVFNLYSPYRIVVDCERGPALPPVPTERIADEKVRPPIPDPEPRAASPEAPTPPRKPAPAPAPKPLAGRALLVANRTIAPSVRPLRAVLLAPADPALLAPLRVTRQFRATRYPTWQPAVIPPGSPQIDVFAAAAVPLTSAVTPALAEKSAPADRLSGELLNPPPNGFSMARQLGLGASCIVIDPGHGGHDPGAEGGGVFEANIVLDVALRLEKLLTAAGIRAVLTRRTDEYIPLEERTAIANRAQGDLFLSIHANASRNRAARGVETYVLNFASTPDAEAVAARENASTGMTMSSLTEIVKAITLNNKLDESRTFAGMVQRELTAQVGGPSRDLRNHGVKQAPFVVLIGASMPSVLAEISFITNAQEGRLLKTGAYRQKIAEALFHAVRGYQKSLKGSAVLTRQ